ncbi:MAG: hypothetical protein CM15mP78_10570 [Candidatus Poseidoniales archaeon]|nr:MAG: hypothetical protein CM15mP78_10570 [Candidatus Poseidoniales archaeon]
MGTKANKHRGRNRYHGRGKKAGRGAGKRGGRGNAGMNKHRVMTRIKYMPKHWGMHGFNRHPSLRTVYSQTGSTKNGRGGHREPHRNGHETPRQGKPAPLIIVERSAHEPPKRVSPAAAVPSANTGEKGEEGETPSR